MRCSPWTSMRNIICVRSRDTFYYSAIQLASDLPELALEGLLSS